MAINYQIEDFNYDLPEEKIAGFPLKNREDSKLLIYDKGRIHTDKFSNLLEYLPSNSYLLFNDTKVISARLIFYKDTGAKIEVFLLEPVYPHAEMNKALEVKGSCRWKCSIGNKKKWKYDQELQLEYKVGNATFSLNVSAFNMDDNIVEFAWNEKHSFAEVIENIGHTPIPPYLHREDEEIDKSRYQTVYSNSEGAVAAPTAGLHFTDSIISNLMKKNIAHGFVTLHVSAGTFKPIQEEDFRNHHMHREHIIVNRKIMEDLLQHDNFFCVGTTSLRTLESLYWMGIKKMHRLNDPFVIGQYDYHELEKLAKTSYAEVMNFLLDDLKCENKEYLEGQTEIFIYPGYQFQLCRGLITNFHLPKSTLLLLIAAFVGEDWKNIYETAKIENFRFLSYGDSSLLMV